MIYFHYRYGLQGDDFPDLQLFFASFSDNSDGGMYSKRDYGIPDNMYDAMYEPIIYKDTVKFIGMLIYMEYKNKSIFI